MTQAEDTGIMDLEGNTIQADGTMSEPVEPVEPVKVWDVCTE